MKKTLPPQKIYIAPSTIGGAGRGVFANEKILEGELIETCPIIALSSSKDRSRLRNTELVNYYFLWGEKRDRVALCLGWGSIYNHSFTPNARYEKDINEGCMDFYALRDIEPNEEIIVNYNGAPLDTTPLRIPGIPAAAGGPIPPKFPSIIEGIFRRARLVRIFLFEKMK